MVFWKIIKKSGLTHRKRIFVFGDSNSICSSQAVPSWPILLYRKAPSSLRIKNESYSGRTTQSDVGELNGLEAFRKKIKKLSFFDHIIFMVGTNDVKKRYGVPSATKVAEGMEKLIETALTSGGMESMVLITPPPMGSMCSGEFVPGYEMIPHVVHEYKQLGKKFNLRIIDLHEYLDPRRHLQQDDVHLNGAGRLQVADLIWKEIFEKLTKFPGS